MSPTTTFSLAAVPVNTSVVDMGAGRVYPGYGMTVGPGEGYTGTQPGPIPGLDLVHILRYSPTHGQMKGKSDYFMRFPRMGLDMGPRMASEWPQNDLPRPLLRLVPRWPPDDLQMTLRYRPSE